MRKIAIAALFGAALTLVACEVPAEPIPQVDSSYVPAVEDPAVDEPAEPVSEATTCDVAREAFLTGTATDITAALKALVADTSADATAREYAQNYLNEKDPDLKDMNKGVVQMACS